MKLSLRLLFLSLLLGAATQLSAADRWSSDETAVRMGLNAWFSLWSRPGATAGDPVVKTLYATSPNSELSTVVQAASQRGVVPSAMSRPERFTVSVHGDRAVSTFQLRPQKSGASDVTTDSAVQVVLTWERRSGLWQIVQESIAPAVTPAERVALSEPVRK